MHERRWSLVLVRDLAVFFCYFNVRFSKRDLCRSEHTVHYIDAAIEIGGLRVTVRPWIAPDLARHCKQRASDMTATQL